MWVFVLIALETPERVANDTASAKNKQTPQLY